ncbi:MAG: inner membrane protein [Flavobacteriales bacterium]|jgi:inner membrane protein
MDSLSQIVLGASIAELTIGKKIGNRALLWGAIAGTIPDLDVLSQYFLDDFLALTYHRGFSHSLIFCLLFAPLLGLLLKKIHSRSGVTFRDGFVMSFWCFLTHIALDCCTSWGTQVFWPFEPRLSTNSVFVVDPLYTLPFLILLITLLFINKNSAVRRKINAVALTLSTAYLLLGMVVKLGVNDVFKNAFAKQEIEVINFETRPTPLNTILWTANAEVEDGYYLGFYSVLDSDEEIEFVYVPKRHELLSEIKNDANVKRVIRMTQGWYSVEQTDSCLVVNDLRFGQPNGWNSEPDDFVFQYVLLPSDKGIHVVVPDPPKPGKDEVMPLLTILYDRAMGNK